MRDEKMISLVHKIKFRGFIMIKYDKGLVGPQWTTECIFYLSMIYEYLDKDYLE